MKTRHTNRNVVHVEYEDFVNTRVVLKPDTVLRHDQFDGPIHPSDFNWSKWCFTHYKVSGYRPTHLGNNQYSWGRGTIYRQGNLGETPVSSFIEIYLKPYTNPQPHQ